MKSKLFLVGVLILFLSSKTDKKAFNIFNSEGKETKYKSILSEALKSDIIFFGEIHNNSICHWLQYELSKDILEKDNKTLILGAEMFEADNQLLMDEFTSKKIRENDFESQARLWSNYKTDYKALVNIARENNLKFVASNIPRRYAAMVSKNGFESLDSLTMEAKKYMAPLPIKYNSELQCYKKMIQMRGGMGKSMPNLPKAQALKDATMSYFILRNIQDNSRLIHFNGSYHSENHEGIVWYIKQQRPDLKILTITTIEQSDIEKLDKKHHKKADFIICVPESMTKTYQSR